MGSGLCIVGVACSCLLGEKVYNLRGSEKKK